MHYTIFNKYSGGREVEMNFGPTLLPHKLQESNMLNMEQDFRREAPLNSNKHKLFYTR